MMNKLSLLHNKNDNHHARHAFSRIVECIGNAKESIIIHMFVWRSDHIGNSIANALLEAANRGVKIKIIKDSDAQLYECIEMNRKPFLAHRLSWQKKLTYKLMSYTFPDTYTEDHFKFSHGTALFQHENIQIEWVSHTHTKYYLFDNERIITGSINIEDRHQQYWDYMIELEGFKWIERFHNRLNSSVSYDPALAVDFLMNCTRGQQKRFEIKPFILSAIANAKESIYIEMAYIGDEDISNAIIQSAKNGIKVTLLFSKKANVGNDINYKTLQYIAGSCAIDIYISNIMIHSKMMMFDGRVVVLGSANLSVYSMQKGEELDVVIQQDEAFLSGIHDEIRRRMVASHKMQNIADLSDYSSCLAQLQQFYQKRL